MIKLLGYQQQALNAISEAFKKKATALVVMATGLGKTVISAFWAHGEIRTGHKGLFLCHNNGILDQAMIEFRKVLGEQVTLKPFYGANKDFNVDKANITFASFQTYAKWKEVFFEDEFDFIIVDESHHGQAPTFKEVILYFKPKKLLGVTATPDRMDLKDIREIFGKEVVNYTLEEAIAKGWLTQVEYHILNDRLNRWKLNKIVKDILQKGKRVSVKQLNETIFIKKRDEEIAQKIQEYAGTDKKTIIFCEKIEHAENFQHFLPDSLTYHSKLSEVENKRRLSALREGSLQYILAVDKFNEGIDVPDVEVVVFLRCTDSKTVFYQQLGRGLRKILGKSKVIVLDFVANCERLVMVKEMAEKIKEQVGNNFILDKNILHVSGKAFDFLFSDEQVDILNLIRRINIPFYKTWQEASKSAIWIGLKTGKDYHNRHKVDPKLPNYPDKFYVDFPGWGIFLRGKKKEYYFTWQEASEAAKKLGISTITDYIEEKKYKQDPKLPSCPSKIYKDFPGWCIFLGRIKKELYQNWQEASKAAVKLNFKSGENYKKRYKIDSKLPCDPQKFYADFPGWTIFLKLEKRKYYSTWQEAGKVARKIGILGKLEYVQKRKQDPKLPSTPRVIYKNFPGWRIFLGTKREFYSTWQEAGKAARKIGIPNQSGYIKRRKKDYKLPSSPRTIYKDFPGWKTFLGKDYYSTWQEAGKAARKIGVSTIIEYQKNYRQDKKLPCSPHEAYKDFPGFKVFLGTKREFYSTWQEAGKAARKIGVLSSMEYSWKYKQDHKLNSKPDHIYKDFPGWKKFLGKEK